MQKVFDTVGKHRNYGPSIREVKEDDRREAQEKMWREAQERAEEERWEAEETRLRATRWEEWVGAERRAGDRMQIRLWDLFNNALVCSGFGLNTVTAAPSVFDRLDY